MEVITDLRSFPQSPLRPVLTIGNFDGVHRGHQAIFQTLIQRAQTIGGISVVLTFDPHPLKILAPERCPPLITPTAKRLALMQACHLDYVVCLPFTRELADLSPSTFVEDVLLGALGMQEIFVGYDFAFGKGRQGTITLLQKIGHQTGFRVHTIEPISVDGHVVSSSSIRQGIQQGRVDEAALLLGRLYSLSGTVIEGYRKGRELGFPTANVQSSYELIPGRGVYAVLAEWRGQRYEGVANIGYNPTFGRTRLSIEIHLFDFAAQLYGEMVEVSFVKKIRDERTFPAVDDLVQQIRQDIARARVLLAVHRKQTSVGQSW
jgi:riboflavin kinase/FMN adenylyltransferase